MRLISTTPSDISLSFYLPEHYRPRAVYWAAVMLSVGLFGLLLWSMLANVSEMARTEGEVVPDGHVQVVQHLEGGIVTDILVKDGDRVSKDQLIVKLNGAGTEQDLAELMARQGGLELQAERLRAFIHQESPKFTEINAPESMKREQMRMFQDMLLARQSEREVIQHQIAQRHNALARLETERKTIAGNAGIARESRNIQKTLLDKGLTSRTLYLKRQEELNTMEGKGSSLSREIAQANQEISEFDQRLKALDTGSRDRAWQELERIRSELAQNKENLTKLNNRVGRLEVRAPVDGYVKGLKLNTLGSVVGSGQTIMEIVPLDKPMVVEIKISPNDIGHVAPGQPVQIKVDAYDYVRYGIAEGTLESISATTFVDNDNATYYRGRVVLAEHVLHSNGKDLPIIPGMTVDANIVTGSKSIFSYLIKPIRVAADTALTER